MREKNSENNVYAYKRQQCDVMSVFNNSIYISDKIKNLKEIKIKLQAKLDEIDLKILNGRLVTLKEVKINKEISFLRSELKKKYNKGKKYKIYNKINYLKKSQIKKEDFENMYKLRNRLIKHIESISIKISELKSAMDYSQSTYGGTIK